MTIGDMVPWNWGKRKLAVQREEQPFFSLQKQMNRLFDDFLSDWGRPFSLALGESGDFTPRVNVAEDEKKFTVTAELPGIDEKDIDISLQKDALVLKGEKRLEREEKGEGGKPHYIERSYGTFQRIIPLGAEIDEDKVDASFKKGVLTIELPKTERAQTRSKKVSIKTV